MTLKEEKCTNEIKSKRKEEIAKKKSNVTFQVSALNCADWFCLSTLVRLTVEGMTLHRFCFEETGSAVSKAQPGKDTEARVMTTYGPER